MASLIILVLISLNLAMAWYEPNCQHHKCKSDCLTRYSCNNGKCSEPISCDCSECPSCNSDSRCAADCIRRGFMNGQCPKGSLSNDCVCMRDCNEDDSYCSFMCRRLVKCWEGHCSKDKCKCYGC